jgi:hypothetical protein
MAKKIIKPTAEMTQMLKATGASRREDALEAQRALAAALQEPLNEGVLGGDLEIGRIYSREDLEPGAAAEYPLDLFGPTDEEDYLAYTIPAEGAIPLRNVESDKVMVPVYEIGSSIDWPLKYSREARWNIVARALEVLEAGFTVKMARDGWHALLAAGADRGVVVFDSDATAGQFTKRLISLMKTTMRRELRQVNGVTLQRESTPAGNAGRMTDLFMSPEALEDIRDWDNTDVDEVTRRDIFMGEDGGLSSIYGVILHDILELGEGQIFQTWYETYAASNSVSNDTMATSDLEIVVGLDLSKNDSFVMPVAQGVQIFEDENLHRARRAGFYGWAELGFAVLDGRRVLIGSL